MIDPKRQRQLSELDEVELCTRIFMNARNELYMHLRCLDIPLSSLGFEASWGSGTFGTDGFVIRYDPEVICRLYLRGRVHINRACLHMVLHCLFCHMDTRGRRQERLWNLACDIAVESVMDGLFLTCVHVPPSMLRRDWYGRLRKRLKVLNAEGVYRALKETIGAGMLNERQQERLETEFSVDDHGVWALPQDAPEAAAVRMNKWKSSREKLQTEMETLGTQRDENGNSLLEQVQVENRRRYDYRGFLRRFAVVKEEQRIDADSFDYAFYTYGLSLYGNMPLVEPLESKELTRIEEFVIVIDTSMSCSGDLVRRFLEETCDVLCQADAYFREVNIHIIQCDEQVRDDRKIRSLEDLEAYMADFAVIGQGGTDFRPAFEYVNSQLARGEYRRLKGLLYFTDGEGIFPVKKPVYDTAFIFVKDQYTDISVPAWAIRVILEPDQLTQESDGADAALRRAALEEDEESWRQARMNEEKRGW